METQVFVLRHLLASVTLSVPLLFLSCRAIKVMMMSHSQQKYAAHAGHIRQTSANVCQRAQTLPEKVSIHGKCRARKKGIAHRKGG